MKKGETYSDCSLYSDSITISPSPPLSSFSPFSRFQPWLHMEITRIRLSEILIKISAVAWIWESFTASQVIPCTTKVDRHYLCAHWVNILAPFPPCHKKQTSTTTTKKIIRLFFSLSLFYLLCWLKSSEVSVSEFLLLCFYFLSSNFSTNKYNQKLFLPLCIYYIFKLIWFICVLSF